MNTVRFVWALPVVVLAACGGTPSADTPMSRATAATPAAAPTQPATGASEPATNATPAKAANGAAPQPALSPNPPADLPPSPSQAAAVTYAWQQFVALNWPALSGQRGVPDTSKVIGQAGEVVWHTWKTPDEIFYPNGQAPPPWSQYGGQVPPECKSAGATNETFVLTRTSKVPSNMVIQGIDEALGGTLTDQHGNLARFEVRLNQAMFNGIVGPQFYSVQAQNKASQIAFDAGVMEVKASWRQMTAADPPQVKNRYTTRTAWIYTPQLGNNPPTCVQGTVGLVGLHITQKTPTRSEWTWATFEQIDNVPPAAPGYTYGLSFNNPSCPVLVCPPNKSTEKNGVPTGIATQVERVVPIGQAAATANPSWQGTLAAAVPGSPFQFYQLIDIQWPQNPTQFPVGNPTPGLLANTTMETYMMNRSSCINCHFTARTQSGKLSSDYSFMLAEAQPGTPRPTR